MPGVCRSRRLLEDAGIRFPAENGAGVSPSAAPRAYRYCAGVSPSAKGDCYETQTALFPAGDSSLQRGLLSQLPDTSLNCPRAMRPVRDEDNPIRFLTGPSLFK